MLATTKMGTLSLSLLKLGMKMGICYPRYVMKMENLMSAPIGIKMERRNRKLMKVLETEGVNNKHSEELRLSLDSDYVRRFWIGFKG